MRRMEIREQRFRKENKEGKKAEVVAIDDFFKNPSEYIINAVPGKQKMVLIDYEKKEEVKDEGKGKAAAGAAGGAAANTTGGFGNRVRHGAGAQPKKEEKKVEEAPVEEKEKKEVEEKEEVLFL